MAAEAVRAFMLSWFLAHNYSPAQAQAMIQQAYIESNLQPCVRSYSGSWLYGWVGVRRQALAAYAGTGGCPSLETQLTFADMELRNEPSFASFWRASAQNAFSVLRRCFGYGRC
jgi:hypothetical protein